MRESAVLDDLRARIAQIEGTDGRHDAIPFGIESIDCRLPGGGIATGTLHEIAGSTDLADEASATVFLAGILARVEGPVFGASAGATSSPLPFTWQGCIRTA